MRGVVLAVVLLTAAVAGPAQAAAPSGPTAAPASGPVEPAPIGPAGATSPSGAVAPAELPDRSPTVAGHSGATRRTTAVVGRPRFDEGTPVAWNTRRPGRVRGADAGGSAGSTFVDRVESLGDPPNGTAPVTVEHELHLTPGEPGALRVELRVIRRAELANASDDLSVELSRRASVIETSGLHRVGDRYRLNAGDDAATLTYRLLVNRTTPDGEYEAVDAGPWALVRTPKPSVHTGGVAVERRYSVDGQGVVDDGLAYVGPYSRYDRTVQGQRLSLVVPAAAEMRSEPTAVMDALSTAARNLHVGDREPSALFVAAPTTVDWAHAAQQVGAGDAWVTDDQSLYDPRNAWLHEYVHVQQSFRPARETRWLVEGSATYYAALLSLRQGLIDFEEFRRHLLSGTAPRNSGAVLAEPATWEHNRAEYLKGALVVSAFDRRIRRASDGWRSFQWVFGRLNAHEGRVTQATLGSLLGTVGDRRLRRTARRLSTGRTVPTTWDSDQHRRTFGWSPPRVSTALIDVRASGPGGTRSLGADPEEVVLLTDERLVATVRAENAGDRRGTVVAPFRVNFTAVDRTVRSVPVNGLATVAVAHRFTEPGTYYVVVGGEAIQVRVVQPARSLSVGDVTVDADRDRRDGAVTVVTYVRNRQDRPARLSLPVTVDGEVVATRTVAVGPNRVRRVETTVALDRPGRHEVAIAGEETAVNVSESGDVVTETGTGVLDARTVGLSPAAANAPAMGLLAVLSALSAGVALLYRRW